MPFLAEKLGFHYSERLAVLSRYRIIDNGQRDYVYVEVEYGKVVAMANVHLPAGPYLPYELRDNRLTDEQAVEMETDLLRVKDMAGRFDSLPKLIQRDIPVFLTGDFNTPSHLDWTEDAMESHYGLAVEWPVSKRLEDLGFRDSFREIYPDPVAVPGYTWTPGEPNGSPIAANEKMDRIDFVYAGGPVATLGSQVVGEKGRYTNLVHEPWVTDHRAVVSEFEVMPAPLSVMEKDPAPIAAALETDKKVYAAGETVTVFYQEANRTFDKIAIASSDCAMDIANLWKYAATDSASFVGPIKPCGQVMFTDTASWKRGTYTVSLMANGGCEPLATTVFEIAGEPLSRSKPII